MQKIVLFDLSVQNQHDNCMVNSLTWWCRVCKEKIEYGTVNVECIIENWILTIEYGTVKNMVNVELCDWSMKRGVI